MARALGTAELAAMLGVSACTLRRHLAAGDVPGFKWASRWHSPEDSISEWMRAECRRTTEPVAIELPPYRVQRRRKGITHLPPSQAGIPTTPTTTERN